MTDYEMMEAVWVACRELLKALEDNPDYRGMWPAVDRAKDKTENAVKAFEASEFFEGVDLEDSAIIKSVWKGEGG